MQKSPSEYESFVFWRMPLPEIDLSELQDLSGGGPADSATARKQEEEVEMTEFSSFNYWRAPIADVGALLADLNLLL